MPEKRRQPLVILCVENSPTRVRDFEDWLPEGVDRLHVVQTGNAAMGVVNRMEPNDYIGVMLDFDLNRASLGAGNEDLAIKSGAVASEALVRRRLNHLPVLVHSHNPAGAAHMTRLLKEAHFDVVQVRYEFLTEAFFQEWVQDCLDQLE
jgi:hypothetical protein